MGSFIEADEALVLIEREIIADSRNWEAWAAKADILCNIEMYKSAICCCDRSLELNSDNPLALITKGISLNKIGKLEEANVALAKAKFLTQKEKF